MQLSNLNGVPFLRSIILLFLLSCSPLPSHRVKKEPIKNVIMIIGDGLGVQQLSFLMHFARNNPDLHPRHAYAEVLSRSHLVMTETNSLSNVVTDSAASASQLATGKRMEAEMVSMNTRGQRYKTLTEFTKEQGKGVGIISDTRLTHATPAAFLTHVPHRNRENDIAKQIIDAQFDIALSGGQSYFIPQSASRAGSPAARSVRELIGKKVVPPSKRKDEINLLQKLREKKYQLVFDDKGLQDIQSGKVIGLFSPSGMPKAMEARKNTPSLMGMTKKALELLAKKEQGFFLMVEAGQIDWAAHSNDAGWMLHELLRFDRLLGFVYDWVKGRKDTLLVVTGDHETGGFGAHYVKSTKNPQFKVPYNGALTNYASQNDFFSKRRMRHFYFQKMALMDIQQAVLKAPEEKRESVLRTLIKKSMPRSWHSLPYKRLVQDLSSSSVGDDFFFPGLRALSKSISLKQQVVWGTGTHTSSMVPTLLFGNYDKKDFPPIMHNSEIGQALFHILK